MHFAKTRSSTRFRIFNESGLAYPLEKKPTVEQWYRCWGYVSYHSTRFCSRPPKVRPVRVPQPPRGRMPHRDSPVRQLLWAAQPSHPHLPRTLYTQRWAEDPPNQGALNYNQSIGRPKSGCCRPDGSGRRGIPDLRQDHLSLPRHAGRSQPSSTSLVNDYGDLCTITNDTSASVDLATGKRGPRRDLQPTLPYNRHGNTGAHVVLIQKPCVTAPTTQSRTPGFDTPFCKPGDRPRAITFTQKGAPTLHLTTSRHIARRHQTTAGQQPMALPWQTATAPTPQA